MKRIACTLGTVGLMMLASQAQAQWGPTTQPDSKPKSPGLFSRMFGSVESKPKWTSEEQQLQIFWTNYYRQLAAYYASLENVDWVTYYKKNGYPIDPRFYNPYGMSPGMTLIPTDPGQPVMIPSAANPVMPASAMMPAPVKVDTKTTKTTTTTKPNPANRR